MPNQALEGLKSLAVKAPWYAKLPPEATQSVEDLREHFHGGRQDKYFLRPGDLPSVPPPSSFQPDPLVVGSPELARQAKRMLDLDPRTKSKVSTITQGPTKGTMEDMLEYGLPIDSFKNTSLLGMYDRRNGALGLSPRLSRDALLSVLVHEIAHASGHEELGAEQAENIISAKRKR